MKRMTTYKSRSIKIFLIFIIPFLICLLAFNLYTMNVVVNDNISKTNQTKLNIVSESFENNLHDIDSFMSNMTGDNLNFTVLQHKISNLNCRLNSYEVLQKCTYMMRMQTSIMGFFLYSKENDAFFNSFARTTYKLNREAIVNDIKDMISGEIVTGSWFTKDLDGNQSLIRAYSVNNTYLICVIDLGNEITTDYSSSLSNTDQVLLYTDKEMNVLAGTDNYQNIIDSIDLHYSSDTYYISNKSTQYIVNEKYGNTSGLVSVYLQKSNNAISNMDTMQIVLFIVSLLSIVFVPIGYYALKFSFINPINDFISKMQKIGNGEKGIVVNNTSSIKEFDLLTKTFNEMLEEIRVLNAKAYENQLEVQQVTMQFLQLQIRPHFYLNCLKNMYAMAQNQKYDQIQETLLMLSDFLRNVFQDAPYLIPLSAELHNVETYVKLKTISNSQTVVCNINADKEISDSLIPPISILTFVENSIKYGAQQQRTLVIDIKIHIIEDYLNISILDNGPGYEENILEQLNSTDANLGKSSIGIENVIKRLKLIYHDKASISFSNDQGACVEIFIPKKPEEDVKL